MVPESLYPMIRQLLPYFQTAAKTYGVEVSLLLAIAWIESAFNVTARSSAGALGLTQMMPATAAEVAAKLKLEKWTLLEPATAINFGAFYFAEQMNRFVLPRVALAAYHAGPTAVARSGGQVPPVVAVERYVRNGMAAWAWFREHLPDIVARGEELKSRGWLLVCPEDDWRRAMPVSAAALPVLEAVAERLQLVYSKDDRLRKVYVGLPGPKTAPAPVRTPHLIVPVLGAMKASNGAYASDTGIDIMAPFGTPIVAAASGTIIYSEPGHTPWATGNAYGDTGNSILIALDKPFVHKGVSYPLTWYTHCSWLKYHVPDGSGGGPHVEQGEIIARVGRGRGISHLHFGVVADRPQTRFVGPFQLAAYFGWMGGG